MDKNVTSRLEKFKSVALVLSGWAAFILGLIEPSIVLKVMLLTAARVLP